jgi:hypothetical protein
MPQKRGKTEKLLIKEKNKRKQKSDPSFAG